MRDFAAELENRKQTGLYRTRRVISGPQQPALVSDGVPLLSFCSNDYLGLASHPDIIRAATDAMPGTGLGGAASHLICGHHDAHHQLEVRLAAFTRRSSALFFSTGYMANMGVIRALTDRGDRVVQDRLNHASLLDGGFLSRARFLRYPHGDVTAADQLLGDIGSGRQLLATDGVFSMDGDLADLPAMAELADRHGAWLMVDDAHGFGVLGERGRGIAEHYAMDMDSLPILIGTLGKSFGTFGAFVAGSEALIESLIQFGRTYIYTTAMPPAVAAASREALKLIDTENWRREKLHGLIAYFRSGAAQLEIPLLDSITPIQPVMIGDDSRTMAVGERLFEAGFWVAAIRPPTVPRGSARLRITLNAEHSEQDIDQLLETLAAALGSIPLQPGNVD